MRRGREREGGIEWEIERERVGGREKETGWESRCTSTYISYLKVRTG